MHASGVCCSRWLLVVSLLLLALQPHVLALLLLPCSSQRIAPSTIGFSDLFSSTPTAASAAHILGHSPLLHSRKRRISGTTALMSTVRPETTALPYHTKVAFQGEKGAYSEKSLRELLGPHVIAVGCPSFEEVFKAVATREAEYALLPIENSLGGSIHACYDLLLRYELYVIAEHEFRVRHSLMAPPGTKMSDIKRVMSHPQALAQCENYLRDRGLTAVGHSDTAGAAKELMEQGYKNTAAIASDLAAKTYGLEVLATEIEDDEMNFTRFLLLSRQPVGYFLSPSQPAKTSVVFTLPNVAGALYKALACFSLRDIDFSKIESRPTSSTLLQYLRYQELRLQKGVRVSKEKEKSNSADIRRFQYCFYLDFLDSELSDDAQNALAHLRESAPFLRVLGSYPRKSQIVGPLKETLKALELQSAGLKGKVPNPNPIVPMSIPMSGRAGRRPLRIGIVGFGNFGRFIATTFGKYAEIVVMSRSDVTAFAKTFQGGKGIKSYQLYEVAEFFANDIDVVILSVSILSFREVLESIPRDHLRGKLVVDVLSVKEHAKKVMLEALPRDADILCTHPMFGPESGAHGWSRLPFIFDKVRIANHDRLEDFLAIWEAERCKMVEMSCEQHDEYAANTQFITHLMGRILGEQGLVATPIDTKGFQSALRLMENTCSDSFDLFYGLYKFNSHSHEQLKRLRDSFAYVERQLAAKEAYLTAKSEMKDEQRNNILSEVRTLLRDALRSNTAAAAAAGNVAGTLPDLSASSSQSDTDSNTNSNSNSNTNTAGGFIDVSVAVGEVDEDEGRVLSEALVAAATKSLALESKASAAAAATIAGGASALPPSSPSSP